jgi:hypothetical protein
MNGVNDVSNKILRAVEWIDKVIEYFRPYMPETKSMTINYKTRDAEIELLLYIPDNMKRKIKRVELPAYQGFVISEMRDESFNRIKELWWFDDGKWKLDPTKLPHSEKYLLTLKGKLPSGALDKIIYIQPATNRDRTERIERYWLVSMIRNIEILERLWDSLDVADVTAGIRIGIERCLSTSIPKELKRRLEATQEWLRAGRGRDWHGEIHRAWRSYRTATQESRVSVEGLVDVIYKLTTGEFFTRYLTVDRPYNIGEVRREETFKGTLPEKMYVEACTYLTLRKPTAEGFLTFKKEEYTKAVKEEIDKIA